MFTSLALDVAGRPQFVYYSWTNRALEYMAWDGTHWNREGVDWIANLGQYSALAARGGELAISYYEASRGDFRIAVRQDNRWIVETVDVTGDVGRHTSLVLNNASLPLVAYYDATHGDLKIARREADRRVLESADTAGNVGQYPSLVLDKNGLPMVAYYDATLGDLKVAQRKADQWITQSVDTTGDVGQQAALALGASGAPMASRGRLSCSPGIACC